MANNWNYDYNCKQLDFFSRNCNFFFFFFTVVFRVVRSMFCAKIVQIGPFFKFDYVTYVRNLATEKKKKTSGSKIDQNLFWSITNWCIHCL
jgi:hypothetical protein